MEKGKPESGPKILSFEEFTRGHNMHDTVIQAYNNFFLNFERGFAGDIYRGVPHYQRFEQEYPGMAQSLNAKVQNRDRTKGTAESLKPFEKELYEAYKIMRTYGVSDEELFA